MPKDLAYKPYKFKLDWKRVLYLVLGAMLFLAVYISPEFAAAEDPEGNLFHLPIQGQIAIGIFLLAGIWWVFEAVPIGITSIMIGVLQVIFISGALPVEWSQLSTDVIANAPEGARSYDGMVYVNRTAADVFGDFMGPSVMFIFASIVIGQVFTKTGLTKRLAYKMLKIVGDRTSMIYLGVFVVTAAMTHIMAHTAVAATIYPLLVSIYALYGEGSKKTKFGKGLFVGMAYVAGAGSIITLLGAARGAVAVGFYKEIVGTEITFFELSEYMFPIGWLMVFILWGFFMLFCKPEKKRIEGLKERVAELDKQLGPITGREILAGVIILSCIVVMSLQSFPETFPLLKSINKSAIILISTLLFYIFRVLNIKDLEEIPWNIILLFGGAMSIGYCLWKTGAATWMAVHWLTMFEAAPKFVFVMSIAFFVLIMTNFIMNVAAISISIPVALVIAGYLGVSSEVILFAALVTAGMPFLLLVGAAPNAIAYDSKQFTSGEFFKLGIPASVILMLVVALAITVIWPIMGMETW